ncbi:TRAP transporter small permease [Cupriavidus numazuensis]|uniref:TRAP transporter small permease protein n=1 Tax=Cupriavidus numazuensis TaxID=221992 RepID=A0ABM8TLR0_9BURK|nr:TRAP transporter small permease [Cupriavidus numazuensis]CAG2153172.1 Ectoine TRAP transporter small permease protein TeaB [Cupriavidus numazuensis]
MSVEQYASPRAFSSKRPWEDWLLAANRWLLITLVAVMSVLVIANVGARYVLSYSLVWVEELTRYMMIWTTFLGAGFALRVGGHIAIDNLAKAFPAKAARTLRAAIVLTIAAALIVLVVLGVQYSDFAWEQETPVLGWSYGQVYLAIPIGAVLTLLHLLTVARQWIQSGEWEKVDNFDPQAL